MGALLAAASAALAAAPASAQPVMPAAAAAPAAAVTPAPATEPSPSAAELAVLQQLLLAVASANAPVQQACPIEQQQ
jgi:hypothetical protein